MQIFVGPKKSASYASFCSLDLNWNYVVIYLKLNQAFKSFIHVYRQPCRERPFQTESVTYTLDAVENHTRTNIFATVEDVNSDIFVRMLFLPDREYISPENGDLSLQNDGLLKSPCSPGQ